MKVDKLTEPDLSSRIINKSPVHYGWVILVVGTIGLIMSSPGQTYSFSIFIEQFINDLGMSRSLVSTLYAAGTVIGSLALPFIGRAIDRRGNRMMVVLISLGFGLVCIGMGMVQNAWMLLLGIIFMRMLGQSSTVIVSLNVINQWWVRRRGFVLGISTFASAILGPGLFPNLINWLIPQIGWRGAYFVLGAMVLGIMLPIGYLFFRERPERYRLLPDAGLVNLIDPKQPDIPAEQNWTRAEAIRTAAFWLITLSIASSAMLNTGLTFHIVSIFADNGLSANLAAAIFVPMSLTTALVSIPGGWLTDRINIKYMLAFGLLLQAITILVSTSIGSSFLAIAYGIVFGISSGTMRVVSSVVYANYFGRAHLGAISGLTSTIASFASGLGPLIYGVGRDMAGSYWPALLISALYPATMVVLVLLMKRPQK